jgi:hypothetical protein
VENRLTLGSRHDALTRYLQKLRGLAEWNRVARDELSLDDLDTYELPWAELYVELYPKDGSEWVSDFLYPHLEDEDEDDNWGEYDEGDYDESEEGDEGEDDSQEGDAGTREK